MTSTSRTVGSRIDRELDLLGVLALGGMPLVAGVYSAEIAAASAGIWSLYAMSASWALGFALVTVALFAGRGKARTAELIAALLCFAFSGFVAGDLGVGGLGTALARDGSLFGPLGGMLDSALHAYGPGGAVAMASVGVFFGWRLARYLPGSPVILTGQASRHPAPQ